MLRNYLLVACRSIWRNKIFSLINIMGLVVGISAALVVYLLVHHENNFDKFHQDSGRMFRVVSHIYFSGDSVKNAGVSVPTAAAMREHIPAVETVAQFFQDDLTSRITIEDKVFQNNKDILHADSAYFRLIQHRWLAGSPDRALDLPYTVVLTKSRADSYFPGLSPLEVLGKEIVYDDTIRTTVTGVVADLAGNTDFSFHEFVSMATVYASGLKEYYAVNNWDNTNSSCQLLVKLRSAGDRQKVEQQLTAIREEHKDGDGSRTYPYLQPFSDIHFNKDYGTFDNGNPADIKQLYALSWVALALLLLAVINFINLTTAQASRRARETGIRKAIGSTFRQLIFQFLSETLLLTFVAALLSLLVAPLLLVCFKSVLPSGLDVRELYHWQVLMFLFSLGVVVTLVAGIYPAWVLARFQPVAVLKGQVNAPGGKVWLRKTLTVSQFVVAQFFIIATLMVSKQIHFSLNKDMGFRKDAILTINTPFQEKAGNKRNSLQEKIRAIPEVAMVSLGGRAPIMGGTMSSTLTMNNGRQEIEKNVEMRYGDSLYTRLYQLKIVAGTNLTNSDTVREWLLNEKAVRAFGYKQPEDILGAQISGFPVVGVVSNFNTEKVDRDIPILAITSAASSHRVMHVLLQAPGKDGIIWKQAIEKIEKAWKEVYPRETFRYEFLDKTIEHLYRKEQRMAGLLNWCAGLAFFISALGLLGLVIFTTNQRTREIGIRKVLGASVWQMVNLLTRDFMKLVMIAFVLAIPLSWWAVNEWLSSYVYRTAMSWWVFAIGGVGMAIMALATMSVKTIGAARSNPVEALKGE
ncbi:ABC transporter permease [Chitinophaga nivalis]|uniref:ABC transporter permease n=1 Tax=Chitinophaga nivalis TaxID=2991709 RepID=A0ABT3IVV8_9BACT|nr:ABC transporter permease [Chitinophaga nivalis]MCW3462192.1 ABC transporter permease [Chitinophaga nivalis]MCW3488116.1 ABC transporter permease [Chitinophaga nivalis]